MIYIIVYPGGDLSKIQVAHCQEYEKGEYMLASRHIWQENDSLDTARKYAIELAGKHGKAYIPFDDEERVTMYILDEEE